MLKSVSIGNIVAIAKFYTYVSLQCDSGHADNADIADVLNTRMILHRR